MTIHRRTTAPPTRRRRLSRAAVAALLVVAAAGLVTVNASAADRTDRSCPVAGGTQHGDRPDGHRTRGDRGLEANKALAVRFYEVFETPGFAGVECVIASGWVEDPLIAPDQPEGPAGFVFTAEFLRAGFPDLEFTVEEVVAEGNRVAVRTTATGTHRGEVFGVPGTGRTVSFRTMEIHEIERGRIVRTSHLEDLFGLRNQITAPAPG